MEEIEYLEEYEEIVMPQLLHNAIGEFLPTNDPYDLLPVDPAFDEFIEEDPLCSVYRNDFQFETTQANNNSSNNSGTNNNTNTIGAITTLSPSITNSIVTVSSSGRTGGGVDNLSSTIITSCVDNNNMIIVQPSLTTQTTTTLINVHNTNINNDDDENSINQHLEYIPTEIVETTVTYENNNQQENNIDNDDILQNNNESNIIYDNSYETTSTGIIHRDNNGGSGVKVLSCETLGTSAFLNVGTSILTSPTSMQTAILDSPITSNNGNRLIGTTSEYIIATHSSNNSINTNLSLLGLPLSPPSIKYQLSSSEQSTPLKQTGINYQQYNSSSSTTNSPPEQQLIATNTTNRSKKLSTIFQNNNLYPQLLGINSGLNSQNSTDKLKTFRNNNSNNLKGFDKLQQCSMKKTINKCRFTDESEIIAIRASSLKMDSKQFLFKSKEISTSKPIYQQQNENYHYPKTSKMTIEKNKPIMSKGSLKQYEDVQKLQVKQIDENNQEEDSDDSLANEGQLNEEYIIDAILNDNMSLNDVANNGKLSNKGKDDQKMKRINVIHEDPPLKATNCRKSFNKILLKDCDTETNSGMFSKFSKSDKSLSKCSNSSSTSLKIDKLDTDLIVAKNTSLKIRHSKSINPLKDSESDSSSNKYHNMMKSKFTKTCENITKCLKDEQIKETIADNDLKAISISGYKKSESKLSNKKTTNVKTETTITTNNKQQIYGNNKMNEKEKHYENKVHTSPTHKIKSKAEMINEVLNSPKVLRVVIPREEILDQQSLQKMNLSSIEKSLISDFNSTNISIYKDDDDDELEKQKELEDANIDPLQLDDDEIVSHFQNIHKNKNTNQLEKNNINKNLSSTTVDEFELFAEQKLKNINNTNNNKKKIDKNQCSNSSESSQPTKLHLQRNNIKTKLSTNYNDNSSTQLINDKKLDDSPTINKDENIADKSDKIQSTIYIKKIKSKSSAKIIQKSKNEKNNIKHIEKDIEIIADKLENHIQMETSNKEKNQKSTNVTDAKSTKTEIFTPTQTLNQEKTVINSPTKITKKSETIEISKSSTKDNLNTITTATVTNEAPNVEIYEAPSIEMNKLAKLTKTTKNTDKSSNEENNKIDIIATATVTVNETTPSVDIHKSVKLPKTPKTTEIVRSKRIASRNQNSTDSHSSSLKETSFEIKDPQKISHSVRSSRDRNSNSSDQNKNSNSPVVESKTNLVVEGRSRNLKKNQTRHRKLSKNSNDINIKEDIKQESLEPTKISEDEKKDTKPTEKVDSNANTNQKTIYSIFNPHLTRKRTNINEESKKEIEHPTGINDDKLKKIETSKTTKKSPLQKKDPEKSDLNSDNRGNILSDIENKNDKLTDNNICLTNKEIKIVLKEVKDGNKKNEMEARKCDSSIDAENKMDNNINKNNTIEETSKRDSDINLLRPSEIPSSINIEKEFKSLPINEDKSKKELLSQEEDKEKEKLLKLIRRQNRELKLLEIDNKKQHIFIEPTVITGRSTRLRNKRSAGGNPIQIARQKPAAKIIRRRQSNIIQISRKEYDRVVNERRAAAYQQNKDTPPVLIPFTVNNDEPIKFLECDKEHLKKKKLKKCKIVLERIQLKYKKPKKLTTTRSSIDVVLPKECATSGIVNSSQRLSVDSTSSLKTPKKRKLNNSEKEICSDPKTMKNIDDQHIEEIPDNTILPANANVETVDVILEGIVKKNIINSKSSNDNEIKDKNTSSKLNISNVTPVIVIEKLDTTIYKESTKKLIETSPILLQTPDKIKSNSTTLESSTATTKAADDSNSGKKIIEDISQKSKDITIPISSEAVKSQRKIHISSRFLPVKTGRNKKNNYKPCRLKTYKSTPNLDIIDGDIKSNNNKVTAEKEIMSEKEDELNQFEAIGLANQVSNNAPITNNQPESTVQRDITKEFETATPINSTNNKPESRISKRKLSETQSLITDGKKQKLLMSNDENSTETVTRKENENEIEQTTSSPKSTVQGKTNSKPQIFIAAPENISRRRNSESNLHENCINENNIPANINLDFSIESWFQDIPSLSNSQMETSTIDILPEINPILSSSTSSADENEGTTPQPLHLSSISTTTESLAPSTTTIQTSISQISKTTKWPLTTTSLKPTNHHTPLPQLQTQQTPQITCTPDISSYSITTPPSTFHIPNIKSINIPAHIVVQTKFLTRDQYMSKLMKNTSTNSTSLNNIQANPINNNLVTGTSNIIINKNSDQRNSCKILERISDLLETQIDTEVRRKMQELIENKTAEDQLRIERLTNIKKIGYTSDFSLQTLVFLQNYFFNTPTVLDNIRNNDNINDCSNINNNNNRNIGNELPTKSSNLLTRNEDFSFRKIRLPIQNTYKNNLQQKFPNRTPILPRLNKNSPINSNKYPISGSITVGLSNNNTQLQNKLIYNKPTTISSVGKSIRTGILETDNRRNLSQNIPTNSIKIPSLTLRQSTSSGQGEQINTDVFLNSTNNTCEPAITNEPESILPDDNSQTILQTEIKEETVEESIMS